MSTEIWRTAIVNGEPYEKFQVSNLGRVMNLNYYNTGKTKLIEPFDDGHGYLQVNLYKNRKQKKYYVHRIVAEAFIPNPDNLTEVNHKDEDKTNNFVFLNEDGSVDKEKSNLEWKSHKGNCNHGTRNKRMAKTKSKKVLQLSLTGDLIREWPSTAECGRNGYNEGHVWACCNGKEKTHKGFRWEYA